MLRRAMLGIVASASICGVTATTASAGSPTELYLSGAAAFAVLGHSCGGIQEQVYATGFAANGYPTGDVYLQTRCGGSGRGGGYKSTTYTAWASVVWTWLGETRSFAAISGPAGEDPTFSAEDAHGDRVYNEGTAAYLQTGEPPLQPPAAPSGVNASVGLFEVGESEYLRMTVTWEAAGETAGLIGSSTVTATPIGSTAPVLTATVSGTWSTAYLGPVSPNTTYWVTVTSTDGEGTSAPSAAVTLKSPNEDGKAEREHKNVETCEQNHGTIKLSPGLSEVPHVQSITVKGELSGCEGPAGLEAGTYVDHLKTTEEVTCSTLTSISSEPTTAPVSLSVKWLPKEEVTSKGTLLLPLSETGLGEMAGLVQGGPFSSPTSVQAASVWESFAGAAACGVPVGKKAAKPVKSGTFSTSEVEFG